MEKQSLMIADEKYVEGKKHQTTEKSLTFEKKYDKYKPSI